MSSSERYDVPAKRAHIKMGIDWGSVNTRVASQHVREGEIAETILIDDVQLKRGHFEIEQQMVYTDHGLIYGEKDVSNWLADHPGLEHTVIHQPKLALCAEFRDSQEVKRIYAAIGCKHGDLTAIQNVIRDELIELQNSTVRFYAVDHPRSRDPRYTQDYWDQLPIDAVITVPCTWGARELGIMRNAAEAAGFENFNFRLEPLCAISAELEILLERGDIQFGQKIMAVDVGGSTCDIGTVLLKGRDANGKLVLYVVGEESGGYAGSLIIQKMTVEYVCSVECPEVMQFGGLKGTLEVLGDLPEASFMRQLSKEIESCKMAFPGGGSPGSGDYIITIEASSTWHEKPNGRGYLRIKISKARMRESHDKWYVKVKTLVEEHLRRPDHQDCHEAMFFGGGFQSEFLHAHLKKSLEQRGVTSYNAQVKCAVTRGTFGQYPQLHTDSLRDGTWVLVRTEYWNSHHEKDKTLTRWPVVKMVIDKRTGMVVREHIPGDDVDLGSHEKVVRLKKAKPINSRSRRSSTDADTRVIDELVTPLLIRKSGQEPKTNRLALIVFVDADLPGRLTLPIYYCEGGLHIRPHSSLRDGKAVKKHFKEWPLQFSDTPDSQVFEMNGYELQEVNGSRFFEVPSIVEIQGREEDLRVRLRMLQKGETFDEDKPDGNDQYRTLFDNSTELWHRNRAHMIPGNPFLSGKKARSRKRKSPNEEPEESSTPHKASASSATTSLPSRRSSRLLQGHSPVGLELQGRERMPISPPASVMSIPALTPSTTTPPALMSTDAHPSREGSNEDPTVDSNDSALEESSAQSSPRPRMRGGPRTLRRGIATHTPRRPHRYPNGPPQGPRAHSPLRTSDDYDRGSPTLSPDPPSSSDGLSNSGGIPPGTRALLRNLEFHDRAR